MTNSIFLNKVVNLSDARRKLLARDDDGSQQVNEEHRREFRRGSSERLFAQVIQANDQAMMPSIPWWDKLSHFGAFFVLAGLCDYSFPRPTWRKPVFIYLFLYGVTLELLQWATQYRTIEYWDVLANTTGIMCYLSVRPILTNIAILSQLQTRHHP